MLILSLTGSEFDEEEAGSGNEDSDDSWTTQDEFTSQIILRCISTLSIIIYHSHDNPRAFDIEWR